MAVDKEKFTDSLILIAEKKNQIRAILQARREAEEALVIEYKIAECNSKRAKLQKTADAQTSVLQSEIRALEASLGQ